MPGLPNDLSLQILARMPRQYYSQTISKVSSSWSQAATSPELFTLRKELGMTESWSYVAVEYPSSLRWFAKKTTTGDSEYWALPLMREDHRPIFGFCCAAIGERLFVMGGCEWKRDCTKFAPTNKVSVFNARTNEWSRLQSMKYARAGFGCGVVDGKIYVAGGYRFISLGYDSDDEDNFHMYQYTCEFF